MSVIRLFGWSRILTFALVRPGTVTKWSSMPLAAKKLRKISVLPAPRKPVTLTGLPKSARNAATLTPLPPGSDCSHSTRLTCPAAKLGIEMVWSMAGFSVTVATRAGIRPPLRSAPGPLRRRCTPAPVSPVPSHPRTPCRGSAPSAPGYWECRRSIRPHQGRSGSPPPLGSAARLPQTPTHLPSPWAARTV